mgnify:CR=1 FL=1
MISPYRQQCRDLNDRLQFKYRNDSHETTEVSSATVDGYQGIERDLIIFSTVRSNSNQAVGFLSDYRRLNVAISRAKRGLIIVGDLTTLQRDSYWCELINDLDELGCVLSVRRRTDGTLQWSQVNNVPELCKKANRDWRAMPSEAKANCVSSTSDRESRWVQWDDIQRPRREDQLIIQRKIKVNLNRVAESIVIKIITHEMMLRPHKSRTSHDADSFKTMTRKSWSHKGRTQNACAADDEGSSLYNAVWNILMAKWCILPSSCLLYTSPSPRD